MVEERSAAPGSSMFSTQLAPANMYKADRPRILHGFSDSDDHSFCALAPQVINHDIDSVGQFRHHRLFILLSSLDMGGAGRERQYDIHAQ